MSNRQRQQLAFISEFVTDIAHVPGLNNVVADALTRQYDDEGAAAIVHSVAHLLPDVNLSELTRDQPSIDEEAATSLKLEHVWFPSVDRPTLCDMSTGSPRILVPEVRRRPIFDALHTWHVPRWAKECQACQASKITVHTRPRILPIPVPDASFCHIHVDLVGPFARDRGFRHLLTIVDRTNRWPEAVPIADTTAETVLQAFLDGWVARFGVPATVILDRGAQFTSEAWRTTLSRLGIAVSTTTSYHPQANGHVERFHRMLKNAVCCAVRMSASSMRSLPVLLGIQNTPKIHTAISTAEVVFRVPLRIPGLCFQSEQTPRQTAAEQLQRARANVEAFSPETLDLWKFKASPFILDTLRTATHVFVRDDRLGKPSLAPKYTGPFRVMRKDWENNTFTLDIGKKEDAVSLLRLKAASVPEEA